jgi:nicotinamidase-related amidase
VENTVLLVVDVQTCMIKEHPYNELHVLANIQKLLGAAREHGLEVVYVRHEDEEGGDLERGSEGWEIYSDISPLAGEKIFDKHFNSAFLKTGLREYLTDKKVDTIILVGLQTEYCIDATCKAAFEHGFQIMIPEETNTTFDNEFLSGEKLYQYYNYKIWNHRFAKVLPIEEVIALI